MGNCCAKGDHPPRPKHGVQKPEDEPEKSRVKLKKHVQDNTDEGSAPRRHSISSRRKSGEKRVDVTIPYIPTEEYEPLSPTLFGGAQITPRKHLLLAARTGNLNTLTALLDNGVSPEVTDNDGRTAVAHSAIRGDASMLKALIRHNAQITRISKDGWSPLHFAVMEKRNVVAEILLASGVDPNEKSTHGFTPLSLAAMLGTKSLVTLLLKHKADRTIADNYGLTPAERAARHSHFDIATLLDGKD